MERDNENDKFYVYLGNIEQNFILNEINKIEFSFK